MEFRLITADFMSLFRIHLFFLQDDTLQAPFLLLFTTALFSCLGFPGFFRVIWCINSDYFQLFPCADCTFNFHILQDIFHCLFYSFIFDG